MKALRLAFMATPEFSVAALKNLITTGHDIICIYSQPPRPAGRGKKIRKSPVHQFGDDNNIEIRCPENFKNPIDQQAFIDLNLDAAIVVAYGLILPQILLDAPRLGCINIHASILPRWRGAAPIQRAILAGDKYSGITIMQMDKGLDTGDILSMQKVKIADDCNAGMLHDKLSNLGGDMIVKILDNLENGKIIPIEQPQDGATYAEKITKDEGHIVWMEPGILLERKIRALNPWPGVYFYCCNERIKVLEAEYIDILSTAGFIIDNKMTVGCGVGALRIKKLQRPGKKPVTAKEFLHSHSLSPGRHLTCYK